MIIFLTTVHVIVCFALGGIVLLQHGKGADMGAAFGGSSQTVFGSAGATTFLGKLTAGAAIVFMLTSLGLTYLASHRYKATIMKDAPARTAAPTQPAPMPPTAPAAPATK
ncbi:MAG: preprotein translocase subunit SecG [Deltaproteobacteria bacterium]|nr:preprotein translocase subunit SecG [Deltaproteobacteria bacterium]